MNRSKIEYCDYTFNPITGCRHGCPYCYAEKIATRFSGDIRVNKSRSGEYSMARAADGSGDLYVLDKPMLGDKGQAINYPFGFAPTLHRYRLHEISALEKAKRGAVIFVGSMADNFGDWVPDQWIKDIFTECEKYPQHAYLFLTKNPKRYGTLDLPRGENFFFGTSVTTAKDAERITKLPFRDTYQTGEREDRHGTYVSIEPILEEMPVEVLDALVYVDWIIIGAETGMQRGKVVPQKKWIDEIVERARLYGKPVFMKDSLIPVVGEENMLRERPQALNREKYSPKQMEHYYGECMGCHRKFMKRDMRALYVGNIGRRDSYPYLTGYLCDDCYRNFCSRYEIKELDKGVWKGDQRNENAEE